jgi:dihydroorotate dehydrogenase (NAD+) catalytic subunit
VTVRASTRLATSVATLAFQNPILLAAGTAGYGRELADVVDLARLGGLVTKAVSVAPRPGAAEPRVADFDGGMINAVGLANPGLGVVCDTHLPWLASRFPRTRKLINIVGNSVEDYTRVVGTLDLAAGRPGAPQNGAVDAYELNVSCPNVRAGGVEFGADRVALHALVTAVRAETRRPIFVKLSPALADVAESARVAVDAGADGLTLVNTMPGLVIDVERRKPALGFGTGGVSGPGLLPIGVLATWRVSRAVRVPIIGVGGISTATDALQYILAGASLIGVGTAAMRDPRRPERILRDLDRWCAKHGVRAIHELVGALEWPS